MNNKMSIILNKKKLTKRRPGTTSTSVVGDTAWSSASLLLLDALPLADFSSCKNRQHKIIKQVSIKRRE